MVNRLWQILQAAAGRPNVAAWPCSLRLCKWGQVRALHTLSSLSKLCLSASGLAAMSRPVACRSTQRSSVFSISRLCPRITLSKDSASCRTHAAMTTCMSSTAGPCACFSRIEPRYKIPLKIHAHIGIADQPIACQAWRCRPSFRWIWAGHELPTNLHEGITLQPVGHTISGRPLATIKVIRLTSLLIYRVCTCPSAIVLTSAFLRHGLISTAKRQLGVVHLEVCPGLAIAGFNSRTEAQRQHYSEAKAALATSCVKGFPDENSGKTPRSWWHENE